MSELQRFKVLEGKLNQIRDMVEGVAHLLIEFKTSHDVDPIHQAEAEHWARKFCEVALRLGPQYGYAFSGPGVEIKEDRSKPWDELPENNRQLFIAIFRELLADA